MLPNAGNKRLLHTFRDYLSEVLDFGIRSEHAEFEDKTVAEREPFLTNKVDVAIYKFDSI